MKVPTIGIIGKTIITDEQEKLLYMLGRIIATAGKKTIIVPAKGTANTVAAGAKSVGGEVVEVAGNVLGQSAHSFVFADERLLNRLLRIAPDIATRRTVTLLYNTIEIELWIEAAKTVLQEKGLDFPVRED